VLPRRFHENLHFLTKNPRKPHIRKIKCKTCDISTNRPIREYDCINLLERLSQRCRRVDKVESCNFTDFTNCSCSKFPTEEMGHGCSKFAPKFYQIGKFLALNFVFLDEQFHTRTH